MNTMEWFQFIGLIADLSMAALVAALFVFATRSRDSADARGDDLAKSLVGIVGDLSSNIRASTAAITGLKECEDETQTIVTGFRREVQGVHGTQLERLDAIQGALAELPGLTAQAVRVSLMDDLLASRAKIDEAIDKIAALREIDKAVRPITPAAGVVSSAEKVRVLHEAAAVNAQMDARKTGEHAVAPPAGERVTDANEQQGG